ncbi:hypothetical protein [Leifsonia xyli]|uniref:hypothetical protein n=1 Tax=Leifsonia xyli TaxID=1575 RepID=UPI00351CA634
MAGVHTEVVRSGQLTPEDIVAGYHDFVLLGPGPGTPEDSGHVEIVKAVAGKNPFSVCASVIRASHRSPSVRRSLAQNVPCTAKPA